MNEKSSGGSLTEYKYYITNHINEAKWVIWGGIACVTSHPGDVLLTATHNQVDSSSRGLGSTISKAYDDGGMFAFVRGIKARFLHVWCVITFQLVTCDQIKQFLGLPGTGA